MTARPVNPAKPSGRSGAPPSAMVAAVKEELLLGRATDTLDRWAAAVIAAMFDNLPRAEMAAQIDPGAFKYRGPEFEERRKRTLIIVDAAISAARREALGDEI